MIPCAARATSRPSSDASPPTAASAASRREPYAAGERAVRRQVAEHDVRVGHRRLAPAATVGRGARVSARRARADAQRAAAVAPGDRAAAGADRLDVEARQCQRASGDRRWRRSRARPRRRSRRRRTRCRPCRSRARRGVPARCASRRAPVGAAGRPGEHRDGAVRARRRGAHEAARGLPSPRAPAARRPRSELRGRRGGCAAAARARRRSRWSPRARTRAAPR